MDLSRRCADVVCAAEAAELACDVADFASHSLRVVESAAVAEPGKLAAYAVTFGTGSVLRVEPGLTDWVRQHTPTKHFRVFQPFFLAELAAETTRVSGGQPCSGHGLTLGFVPDRLMPAPELPPGYVVTWIDKANLAPLRETYAFENSLGERDEPEQFAAALGGFAVIGPWGQPLAFAGAWDEGHGRYEIGVDVRRSARGLRLAEAVVGAMTRWILDQGKTPIYTCGATNVRSHRVALACGYRPLWTIGMVWRRREGESPYNG